MCLQLFFPADFPQSWEASPETGSHPTACTTIKIRLKPNLIQPCFPEMVIGKLMGSSFRKPSGSLPDLTPTAMLRRAAPSSPMWHGPLRRRGRGTPGSSGHDARTVRAGRGEDDRTRHGSEPDGAAQLQSRCTLPTLHLADRPR